MLDKDQAVLLIEPDPDLRSAICELLEVFGYRVLVASNLEKALLSCEQSELQIECLVVAAFLPRSTGLEVVDAIGRSGRPLPALLFSAFAADEAIQRRMLSGDVDFLAIPFSPESFRSKVGGVIERQAVNHGGAERSSM